MKKDKGELGATEFHPSAKSAFDYIKSHSISELNMILEACSSCAIEGNRLGEICAETLNRILRGEPVSDRYVLGLAWFMQHRV